MNKQNLTCLSCGNLYEVDPAAEDKSGEQQCPRCKSTFITKLNFPDSFGSAGKGG